MTETCSQIATTSPEDHYRPKGSVGKSLSNIDIKFDKNNQILVSGPTVARYFGTKRRKKWLETGDLGYIDKSGYLYLIGRFDEQIISGGENINPTEIESEIIKIPYIDEAVIFGIKDNYWGEKVVLAISSKKKNISLEQINKKLKKLDSYKYPKKLIVFSDPLPKNNIGKIDKNKLKTKITKCKV
jgi:O-succinylbenzoic acid--CoA ligase